jgi:hypothetical protein
MQSAVAHHRTHDQAHQDHGGDEESDRPDVVTEVRQDDSRGEVAREVGHASCDTAC